MYAACITLLGPGWGRDLVFTIAVDHVFSFALWAHHIDLIGRSLHADIASIRPSTLVAALYGSCRGCCPQCQVAPFHYVCSGAAQA
jgi:hypothetical protein